LAKVGVERIFLKVSKKGAVISVVCLRASAATGDLREKANEILPAKPQKDRRLLDLPLKREKGVTSPTPNKNPPRTGKKKKKKKGSEVVPPGEKAAYRREKTPVRHPGPQGKG